MKIPLLILTSLTLLFIGCMTMPTFTEETVISDSIESEVWKEALVVDILSKSPELNIHRMNGEEENQVYVHDNGTEVVLDSEGKRVTSEENQGSYNYYHPVNRPIAHYMADIKPWILFANTPNDPTNKKQRLNAYSLDLAIGIYESLNSRSISTDLKEMQINSKEELKVVRKWVKVFKSSSHLSIFDLYERKENISYEVSVEIAKSIINNLP